MGASRTSRTSASRRRWWAWYLGGASLTLAALSWISLLVQDLERAELEARARGAHEEAVRLALWRMDSWFAPQLAIEVARLPREYRAYSPQEEAYTKVLGKLAPGEVLVPSPLLDFRSDVVRLHFQVDSRGAWSSPQVPTSNRLDLAQEAGLVSTESLEARRADLERLRSWVSFEGLGSVLRGEIVCEPLVEPVDGARVDTAQGPRREAVQQEAAWGAQRLENFKNVQERKLRAQTANRAPSVENGQLYGFNGLQVSEGDAAGASTSSPLVPVWFQGGGRLELCFVRRVTTPEGELLQGFLADWQRLEQELLGLVADILPEASLRPRPDARPELDEEGRLLATVPASLEAVEAALDAEGGWSPATTTLALAWLVTLAALGAVGSSLRSSIHYGEQRQRFASAVTHELRTPLTTFRMYSEMLARGMVPEESRAEYLATLERESNRLSNLVENVLCYSRLEEGRTRARSDRTTLCELLHAVLPELQRRVGEAGMSLQADLDGARDHELEADPDAVAQILFNLVDNACKYGAHESGGDSRAVVGRGEVSLLAGVEAGSVWLRIQDSGPGVPAASSRAIFEPFDRGPLDAADSHPGVGLGLALSRGLARHLGGDLVLEGAERDCGASFKLTLPGAPRHAAGAERSEKPLRRRRG